MHSTSLPNGEVSDKVVSTRLPSRYVEIINIMARRTKKNRADYLRDLLVAYVKQARLLP